MAVNLSGPKPHVAAAQTHQSPAEYAPMAAASAVAAAAAATDEPDTDFDEDRAPSDFNVTSAHELQHGSHGDPWSSDGCLMRCTLCTSSRRSFHCRDCVQTGNFIHSTAERLGEPFAVKRTRYEELLRRHRELTERAQQALEPQRRREVLEYSCLRGKQRAQFMQAELQQRRERLAKATELHKRLTDSIEDTRKKFPQFQNNVEHLRNFVQDRLEQNERLELQRAELQRTLQARVRRMIGDLVAYVFPISTVMNRSTTSTPVAVAVAATATAAAASAGASGPGVAGVESQLSGTMLSDVEHVSNALAEATRTAYVRGRWVLQDSQHELHHVVVAPSLPGNGDYSAYVDWLQQSRDGSGAIGAAAMSGASGSSSGGGGGGGGTSGGMAMVGELANTSQNDGYRIAAALTYTTQLVNLLGFYLNVHLPHRMNYSDFCNKELTASSFQRKVARLNGNVLALCYSQNVSAQQLVATHTLANLQHLLAADDLGRCGSVSVANSLVADVLHLNADLQAGADDSDSDDENSFPHEWEAVPHLSPHETFIALPSPQQPPQTPPFASMLPPMPVAMLSMTAQQTTSMANGLVNNAVGSVTSMWRAFTGR